MSEPVNGIAEGALLLQKRGILWFASLYY